VSRARELPSDLIDGRESLLDLATGRRREAMPLTPGGYVSCRNELELARINATKCAQSSARRALVVAYLKKRLDAAEQQESEGDDDDD